MPAPTVGRIVHLKTHLYDCVAAIVTEVHDAKAGMIALAAFSPSGFEAIERHQHILPGDAPYTWHWPEIAQEPEPAAVPVATEE